MFRFTEVETTTSKSSASSVLSFASSRCKARIATHNVFRVLSSGLNFSNTKHMKPSIILRGSLARRRHRTLLRLLLLKCALPFDENFPAQKSRSEGRVASVPRAIITVWLSVPLCSTEPFFPFCQRREEGKKAREEKLPTSVSGHRTGSVWWIVVKSTRQMRCTQGRLEKRCTIWCNCKGRFPLWLW